MLITIGTQRVKGVNIMGFVKAVLFISAYYASLCPVELIINENITCKQQNHRFLSDKYQLAKHCIKCYREQK